MKKADTLHRAIAKVIDFLIVGVLCLIPLVGMWAAALYILISDGFFNGRSVGKRSLSASAPGVAPPSRLPHPERLPGIPAESSEIP